MSFLGSEVFWVAVAAIAAILALLTTFIFASDDQLNAARGRLRRPFMPPPLDRDLNVQFSNGLVTIESRDSGTVRLTMSVISFSKKALTLEGIHLTYWDFGSIGMPTPVLSVRLPVALARTTTVDIQIGLKTEEIKRIGDLLRLRGQSYTSSYTITIRATLTIRRGNRHLPLNIERFPHGIVTALRANFPTPPEPPPRIGGTGQDLGRV